MTATVNETNRTGCELRPVLPLDPSYKSSMKQLTVIVKPFRAEAVLQAAAELGVAAGVVREAKGYGRQKGYLERYVGSEYSLAFLPKVEVSLWVKDDEAEVVAERIAQVARTGRIGDGKILILPVPLPQIEF